MIWIRRCAALAMVIAAGFALNEAAIVPYRVNVLKAQIARQYPRLASRAGIAGEEARVIENIRDDARLLEDALRKTPTDVDLYMELAAFYQLLSRFHDAVHMYEEALRFDRRPEIYVNLAEAQLAAGDIRAATESYANAVAFAPEEAAFVPPELLPAATLRSRELIRQLSAN